MNSFKNTNLKSTPYYILTNLLFLYMFLLHRDSLPGPLWKFFCFLTNLNFLGTWYYFIFRLVNELNNFIIIKSSTFNWLLKIQFIMGFVVVFLYWALIFYDKDLVVPRGFVIPACLDYFLHGGVWILVLIEIFTKNQLYVYHSYNELLIIVCSYISLLKGVYYIKGVALYPFVEEGIITFVLVIFASLCFMALGDLMYKLVVIKVLVNKPKRELDR